MTQIYSLSTCCSSVGWDNIYSLPVLGHCQPDPVGFVPRERRHPARSVIRISGPVKKCLQSAIANAENNHELDVDRLVVAEANVGKGIVMKRWRPRARGRTGKILKPFSHLTIVVRERAERT